MGRKIVLGGLEFGIGDGRRRLLSQNLNQLEVIAGERSYRSDFKIP